MTGRRYRGARAPAGSTSVVAGFYGRHTRAWDPSRPVGMHGAPGSCSAGCGRALLSLRPSLLTRPCGRGLYGSRYLAGPLKRPRLPGRTGRSASRLEPGAVPSRRDSPKGDGPGAAPVLAACARAARRGRRSIAGRSSKKKVLGGVLDSRARAHACASLQSNLRVGTPPLNATLN